jgi:hypothetical protein
LPMQKSKMTKFEPWEYLELEVRTP